MTKMLHTQGKMKPANISFKTTQKIKEILEEQAKEGFRSLSAQVEMIVIKHLESERINWEEEDDGKDRHTP